MTPKMKVGLKSAISFIHGPGAIRSVLQRESYTETMTPAVASLKYCNAQMLSGTTDWARDNVCESPWLLTQVSQHGQRSLEESISSDTHLQKGGRCKKCSWRAVLWVLEALIHTLGREISGEIGRRASVQPRPWGGAMIDEVYEAEEQE